MTTSLSPSRSRSGAPLEVLVLGGGYAGVLAASRVAGRLGARAAVTLVSEREDFVDRIRLHEALAGRRVARPPLRALVPAEVRLVRGRATGIRAAAREVALSSGQTLGFGALVVALGSRVALPVPGAAAHAGWLASPDAAAAGAARLRALPAGAPVTVVGGGLTAIEAASEIAEAHPRLSVTLLAPAVGADLSAAGRAYLRRALHDLGVLVREGERVEAIEAEAVRLAGGVCLPSAFTVWAAGFAPGGLGLDGDLPVDVGGRLVVDAGLAAGPGIFVAGDAAAPAPGLPFLRMGCVSALPMGAHAADAVVDFAQGRPPAPFRFSFAIRCISLGRRRGLVQKVDARDRPLERVVTGRSGAVVKELVCRFVMGTLRIERRWAGAYRWPRGIEALPAAPAAAGLLAGAGTE